MTATDLVFVYGTLRPGERNAHWLTRARHLGPAVSPAAYTLCDTGPYPAALKARVAGRLGHLSNAQAAALLTEIDTRDLQHVVVAHMSESNNRPELAQAALAKALTCAPDWVHVAHQREGLAWRSLSNR